MTCGDPLFRLERDPCQDSVIARRRASAGIWTFRDAPPLQQLDRLALQPGLQPAQEHPGRAATPGRSRMEARFHRSGGHARATRATASGVPSLKAPLTQWSRFILKVNAFCR